MVGSLPLYDDRGSELFEQICELPEYYLTRTEEAILERAAGDIIAAAPVECIVELGAGSAKKTTHLLTAQIQQRKTAIFAPIDVSLPGLILSREFNRTHLPQIRFHGLHARYEEGFASIDKKRPRYSFSWAAPSAISMRLLPAFSASYPTPWV